jgi:subtilase family serine protease
MFALRSARSAVQPAFLAAILLAAALCSSNPGAADIGNLVFTPHYVGTANSSAARDFTVNLRAAATKADADLVARYFRGFGLRVRIDAADGILFARGTIGEAAAAAHSSYKLAASGGAPFLHLVSQPSFPPDVAVRIRATTLQDGPSAVSASIVQPAGIQVAPLNGYSPNDIGVYYDITPLYVNGLSGKGQNIAIVACNTVDPKDIAEFEVTYGYPSNVPTIVFVAPPPNPGTAFEPTGDVERVIGTAARANVTLYVAGQGQCSFADLANAMAQVVSDNASKHYIALSHSYGATEDLYDYYNAQSTLEAEDVDLADLLSANTTPFVASGDWGAFEPLTQALSDGEVDAWFPASDNNVLAVGGTTAATENYHDPVRSTEYAWGSSGGNVSGMFALPSWQVGVSGLASQTMRNLPDLAFDADIYTGYTMIYTPQGGLQGTYFGGGTSFATPTWAGILALIDQARVKAHKSVLTSVPSNLYALRSTSAFFDIVQGCNGVFCAKAGYDNVTGIGVPDVRKLKQALLALP